MGSLQEGDKQENLFFNDTATTEIYPLSLHDALPISAINTSAPRTSAASSMRRPRDPLAGSASNASRRSEEHTSELQSPCNLVCRLLLEKKKNTGHLEALLTFGLASDDAMQLVETARS